MDILTRGIRFVARNIVKNPLYVLRYGFWYPQKNFFNEARFLENEQLTEELRKGRSLIRLGDGEIYMINYGSIPQYQPYNLRLRKIFLDIIQNYTDTSPYILGIPEEYVNMPNYKLKERNLLRCWLPLKILFKYIFPHNASYFDAHAFYREGGFEKVLKSILETHQVLVATSKKKIDLLVSSGLETKVDVTYVQNAEYDAFKGYDKLITDIKNRVGNAKSDYRVVLAVGPTSKALAYELSSLGYVCYDIGKGIETMYRKNEIEYLI